jgi:hypothetical protein
LWSSPDANSITSISKDKDTQEKELGAILKAPVMISWKQAQSTQTKVVSKSALFSVSLWITKPVKVE